ncbi:hypothetical protein [Leptospira borgpetersenii]|uniref:hypothetical protein n=2 Tax=Leptospira borgpetersenii TaxID=174 RepID=UPI001D1369FE|nr:hypothetical protein [Leptospira borgpetersenii]
MQWMVFGNVWQKSSALYIFHLRGNQRTSGELSRKEGGKLFGSGSRAPIAITLFVKNPDSKNRGQILFHDVGDYLSREDKLQKLIEFKSIQGITEKKAG